MILRLFHLPDQGNFSSPQCTNIYTNLIFLSWGNQRGKWYQPLIIFKNYKCHRKDGQGPSCSGHCNKSNRLDGLSNQNLFLMVLEVWNQDASMLKSLVRPLLLVMNLWGLSFPWCVQAEKERSPASSSFYKGINPIIGVPTSWPNYLPKVQCPNTIILGIRDLTYSYLGI